MGNATDTMTGLFNSFLRLSVALVVLGGLSTGAAMGQTFVNPSQTGINKDGNPNTAEASSASDPYFAGEFQDAIQSALARNEDLRVLNSGDLNNQNGVSQYDLDPTGRDLTIEGDGEVTVTLDLDLNLRDKQLTLDGVSPGDGVNIEFPGNDISLLADGSAGTNVRSTSSSDTANRIVFSGEGAIEELNQTGVQEVVVQRLSVEAPVTYNNNDDPGVNPDELTVNQFLAVDGELDLGGNTLNYGQAPVDIDPDANDLSASGTVTNGQRFNINLGNSGGTSYNIEGSGDFEVPVTYQNGGAPLDTARFEQTSIGQFGFSNFGTAGPVNRVEFQNLSQVRANIQIEGSDADVVFESDVDVESKANILNNATATFSGTTTFGGDVAVENATASFATTTFEQGFEGARGPTVTFNAPTDFNTQGGSTRFGGGAPSSYTFAAPGMSVDETQPQSVVEGAFSGVTNGTVTQEDDTGNDNGLHNVALNGDIDVDASDLSTIVQQGDTRLFINGGSQDFTVENATFTIDRLTVRDGVSLLQASGGDLAIDEELRLEDGDFLANGNLDMSGATLIRSSTSSETGRLQDGTSNIAYTGTVSSADTPFRIEYVGSDNIPTGDELLPASADSSERTVGEFVVDSEEDVATTLATDYLYTVTSSLEIRAGDLAFSDDSSLRLANMSTFVRGDGRLITEELVDPEEALRFPDVADADVGTDGIDLSYVNTADDEDTLKVGIEWPDQDKNVVRNVYVHGAQENEGDVALRDQDGGQSTYRLNGDFALGAGTFYFNGQNLEANAQNGPKTFAIAGSASVNTTEASTLRFIGPDAQAVAGVHQSSPAVSNTYNLPTTIVEKDTSGGNEPLILFAEVNGSSEPQEIQVNGDFEIRSIGNDVGNLDGFLALQLDEFTVTNDLTQQDGFGLVAAADSFNVRNNLTKATDDTTATLLGIGGNRINVGADVTHSGATDSDFVNNGNIGGGLVLWTAGSSDESTIDIGGDVTQEDGYASLATTVSSTTFTEEVDVGGDVTVNGGQFLFDNPFSAGPVASERVDIGGTFAVEGGQVSGNLFPYSQLNRREVLAASSLQIGAGGTAGTTSKTVEDQVEGIVGTMYASGSDHLDADDVSSREPLPDGLYNGGLNDIEAFESTQTGIDGEDIETLSPLSNIDFDESSGGEEASAKSAHEGNYDRFDIDGATTIETDGRFLLGAHSLEVGGDFTFEGQGDLTTNNSTAPQTGLAGLVTFNGDSEQAITVGNDPDQYLHGVAVDGEGGINLQTNLTLSRASTDTTNTVPDQFDRAFGTLFLERGNVVTGEDSLKIKQPTPTTNNDLAQALNADEISANGTAAPQSPVIGGTRNSHIEGALQRTVEDQGGSTGGFVTDGYIYPLGDGENYNGIVLQLPTDLGDTQTFTVSTVEPPEIELPENLTSEGVDSDGNRITLDLNVQTRPYYEIGFTGEEPDEDFNIRAIAGELSGATIDDIKQMRLVQFDRDADEVQEAGRYDVTGDPNDDFPRGPNSFVSSVPNVIHEGVDLREGNVIGLASDTEYNLLGPGAPSFTAVPSDQDLNVGESAEVTFTAEDSNTDVADLNFSTSGDVNVSSSSKSGNDFTVTVEPDSADAEESFVQGGADNALDLTVEVTDSVNNTASATVGVTVGLQNGDANSSGSVNTEDASTALDAFLGNVSLTPVQTDAADQNGDDSVTPFDAAEILQIALGGSSAQVAKAGDASAGTVVIGDADRSDGTTTLPVELTGDAENVRSVAVEIDLDGASQQEVKNVATNLPSGWIADHESSSDGTLKIGMAGSSALSAGEIATIQLQGADDPADETSGTFRLNGSDAQDLEVQVSPESFALNGNYPNPFSTATTISYDLKEAVNVSIEVYDVLGRKVGTLVNKKQSAGSYEVTLNRGSGLGAQMSSGVYVYRIKAGDFTASEKMTVVR